MKQSIRSRLIIWLIKNRHLFKLRLKAERINENFSVSKFRDGIEKASRRMKLPKEMDFENLDISGTKAEWITPGEKHEEKILLYIHGGGFISGSCNSHRPHVAKFAKGCGMKTLHFEYRLAPEHPFPAAVEDCVKVYKFLINSGQESANIIIGGESAGATLVLSLLLSLKEQSIALPSKAFVISPITDLRHQAASFTYNEKNDIANPGACDIWLDFYVGNNDPTQHLLSPQFGDFKGLPPLYICVGTYEIHYDDCVNLRNKAQEQGVKVKYREWDKMVHAFPLLSPLFPEAKKALQDICAFVKSS